MLNLLAAMLCILQALGAYIVLGLVLALNYVVKELARIIAGLIGLLPNFPAAGQLPAPMTQALGWVNWFFPVTTVIDLLLFALLAWLAWWLVGIALRWAKALGA